ncbi:TPA: hypothetical protein MJA02_18355 [Klebsiella pneumoniae]|nr:Uncharacterised protein [Klebsiella pneumoniae]SWN38852.1 Uncharacterised protein [Klebsiella pneumoniae]HBY9297148.1 hypothetical protein [Klebsiella pneumoniae]
MVTIRVGEKATFISLPVSGFADVVEVVVLWFSSGLYSSLWGWFFSVYGVMACALFLSFTLRGGSVGDVVSGLLSFSACEVMAFPAYQEVALSFGVRVGKRDGAGDCSGLVLSGVSSRVFSSVYWGMAFREIAFLSSLFSGGRGLFHGVGSLGQRGWSFR